MGTLEAFAVLLLTSSFDSCIDEPRKNDPGNFLVVQWLVLCAFTVEDPVQSVVGELRSHKPCGVVRKREMTPNGVYWDHFLLFASVTPSWLRSHSTLPCVDFDTCQVDLGMLYCRHQERRAWLPVGLMFQAPQRETYWEGQVVIDIICLSHFCEC